jgi:hypothetical protein
MLGIFTLAVIMRVASLVFNEAYFEFDPHWYAQSRNAIILGLSNIGRTPLPSNIEAYYGTTVETAKIAWPLMDRGLVFVYLFLKSVFGQTSYLALQITQLLIDAFLVFIVAAIGNRLGGNKAALGAGLAYAVFLPQIWISTMPEYNAWLTFTYILLTWLMIVFVEAFQCKKYRHISLIALGIAIVGFIGGQMRSIAILAPLGLAGWYWFWSCLQNRTLRVSTTNVKATGILLVVGICAILGSSAANKAVRGDVSPVRSTFGHSFWAGIGQFDNPFGVQDLDGSILKFYTRETGIESSSDGAVEYNSWLTNRGIEFVKDQPFLYLSMIARRALMILSPNMPFTIVADMPAYSLQEVEITRVKNRKALQALHGRVSPTTIFNLVNSDPAYVVGLLFRLLIALGAPIGVIGYLVLSKDRALGVLALFPLGYVLITLAPFYITPVVLVPTHTAILPVIVAGWILIFEQSNNQINKLRAKYNS